MEDRTRLELLPIDLSTPLPCAVISCLYIYIFIFCILRSFYKISSRTTNNRKAEGGDGVSQAFHSDSPPTYRGHPPKSCETDAMATFERLEDVLMSPGWSAN